MALRTSKESWTSERGARDPTEKRKKVSFGKKKLLSVLQIFLQL
jgi:hypothetical protein